MNNQQQNPQAEKIEIHTSAYDIVGGTYPTLGMLRCNPRTKRENRQAARVENLNALPIDAIIITGSLASSYQLDEYPWITQLQEFIQRVWKEYPAVKMFGSCFGHQLIAQALLSQQSQQSRSHEELVLVDEKTATSPAAAHVEPCPQGFEIGIHPITLTPEFVSSAAPYLSTLRNGEMRIQLFHGDRVVSSSSSQDTASLPAPWMNIGSTELSPIQGLFHPSRVLTYQGHFEFDAWVNMELVVGCTYLHGWTAEMIQKYMDQIGPLDQKDDDSKLAAEVVVWFFAEEDNSSKGGGGIKRFTERVMKKLCLG